MIGLQEEDDEVVSQVVKPRPKSSNPRKPALKSPIDHKFSGVVSPISNNGSSQNGTISPFGLIKSSSVSLKSGRAVSAKSGLAIIQKAS